MGDDQLFNDVEVNVLECLASGWSASEAASELECSISAISSTISRIKKKIGFYSQTLGLNLSRQEEYRYLCNMARRWFCKTEIYRFNPHPD